MGHVLIWLWAMVNHSVAFYRIDPHRSKQAFLHLIDDWKGILVSDSYGLCRKWIHGRQVCLAYLICKADALVGRRRPDIRRFGQIVGSHLCQLIGYGKDPPTPSPWKTFYAHLLSTLSLWESDDNDAGKLARQMVGEIESLWTFLGHEGGEPTNNRAKTALRFTVLWRKRSLGTQSDKGNRWMERILSLKETCRPRSKSTFQVLSGCIRSCFNGTQPDLSWI